MTRRRTRPRIEIDLVRFNVDAIIKNKPDARHSFGSYTLIDEKIGGVYVLVVYTSGKRTQIAFPISEVEIKGRIRNQIPIDNRVTYFVIVYGKRCRYLYFNPATTEFGSKASLRATYTSESIGPRKRAAWRALQRARRCKMWGNNKF